MDNGKLECGDGDRLLPARSSLVALTVDCLRRGILSGRWEKYLPAERELCSRLQVARNTLRRSLNTLEVEGWIGRSGKKRRREIIGNIGKGHPARRLRRDLVVFLTESEISGLNAVSLLQLEIMRERLYAAGVQMRVRSGRFFLSENPRQAREGLFAMEPPAVWVLHRSPRPIQEWFVQRRVPCIVLGYPHDKIRLPYVTDDVAAAVVHAVGRLVKLGHRRLALLRPRSVLAGHLVADASMSEVAARHKSVGLRAVSACHDATPRGIAACVDNLLGGANPPTAFLTVTGTTAVTVITHLGHRGVNVPRDVSVISLFDDPILQHLIPQPSRYSVNQELVITRLTVKLLAMRDGGLSAVRSSRIIPNWIAGETVGPVNSVAMT